VEPASPPDAVTSSGNASLAVRAELTVAGVVNGFCEVPSVRDDVAKSFAACSSSAADASAVTRVLPSNVVSRCSLAACWVRTTGGAWSRPFSPSAGPSAPVSEGALGRCERSARSPPRPRRPRRRRPAPSRCSSVVPATVDEADEVCASASVAPDSTTSSFASRFIGSRGGRGDDGCEDRASR